MRKGCEIEACPGGDGFKGAWFKAILESVPKKPARKYKVRFLDLEDEDDGSYLIQTTFQNYIRPVPPLDLFCGDEFEEGSLVEAAHRDGWWVGVFVKKLDDNKYLVYFDSPPDLFCFKREELRQHFDWTSEKWVRPRNKKLSKKSSFSCGTMVEVMEERKDVVWVEAIVVKEMADGERFIVKSCKDLRWNDEMKPKRTVSLGRIRCIPPLIDVERYNLMEPIEVFIDPGWRPGLVTEVLYEKQYAVRLDATKEISVFRHSDLRLSEESMNCRGFLSTPGNAGIASQSSQVENVEADIARMEPSLAQGSGNVRNAAIATKQAEVTAQGMTSHKKTLEDTRNQNCLENESVREKMREEHNREDGCHKKKIGEPEHNSELNEAVLSSDQTASSADNVEETNAEDTVMVLPFVKTSLAWKIYETMEVPQNPHFSPLLEIEEDFREGSALGLMVTYSGLMHKLKGLKTDIPVCQLESLKNSFAMLEEHGFNVTTMLSRINTLLALKDTQLNIMHQLNGIEKEEKEAEEEWCEAVHRIAELKEQKEAAYQKIRQVESCAIELRVELMDVENEFEKTLSAPW